MRGEPPNSWTNLCPRAWALFSTASFALCMKTHGKPGFLVAVLFNDTVMIVDSVRSRAPLLFEPAKTHGAQAASRTKHQHCNSPPHLALNARELYSAPEMLSRKVASYRTVACCARKSARTRSTVQEALFTRLSRRGSAFNAKENVPEEIFGTFSFLGFGLVRNVNVKRQRTAANSSGTGTSDRRF